METRNDLALGFTLGMLYIGVVILVALCLEQKRSIRALRSELHLERMQAPTPQKAQAGE